MSGTPITLAAMKRQAKAISREGACTHMQALEALARNAGYGSYAAARRALDPEGRS